MTSNLLVTMESARNHGRFAPKRAPCRTTRRRERAFLPLRYIAAFPPFRADQSPAAIRRADSLTCPCHQGPGACGGRGSTITACSWSRLPAARCCALPAAVSEWSYRRRSGRNDLYREKDDELRHSWAHTTPRRGRLIEIGGILAAREVRVNFHPADENYIFGRTFWSKTSLVLLLFMTKWGGGKGNLRQVSTRACSLARSLVTTG